MFHRAHLYFTLLFTGISTAIMVCMSLLYLRVSENNLWRTHFSSFQNDASTFATALEQSSSVSMQWLSKLEARGNYLIFIIDNGVPFLYNELQESRPAFDSRLLIEESLAAYDASAKDSLQTATISAYYGISHSEYTFISPSCKASFYCSLINMEQRGSDVQTQIIMLLSTEKLHQQVNRQRILFLLIIIAAALALCAFSWFFTGKILKPLRENQQRQTQFIAAASHELRTPLSVILANDECCQNAPAAEQQAFHLTIQKEGRRMKNLIDDMLTLACSDLNRFAIRRVPTETDTLCMHAYEAFEPLAREKGVLLTLSLPEESVPRFSLDPDRITQVLSILLHNAISYTHAGGSVCLTLKYDSSHIKITVTDTGVGISDADKKQVFDRFFRAEKSRSSKEHFGLGLSVAHEIVAAHHGKISVHDNPGGGSVFLVELPW